MLKKNPIKFVKSIIYGRDDYSPKVQKILEEYGNQQINKIEIVRTPLSTVLKLALNTASLINFENFSKNQPYDKLYHLSILCHLSSNTKILIEKNEVINLEVNPSHYLKKESEKIDIDLSSNITLNELLENTKNRMGKSYFTYNASSNNCQQYIVNILRANNLNTPENEQFVFQDLKTLFSKIPKTKQLMDTVTEIGARVDVIKQGGGDKQFKPYSMKNGLYSNEIEKMLSNIPYFRGVYSKDQLPNKLENGWYVINMQNSNDGDGTHWTCFKKNPNSIYYYDAFGFQPPKSVLQHSNNHSIYYSNKQIQNELSTACGFFCIACIRFNTFNKGSDLELYKKFLDLFSNNTLLNDQILKDLF